MQTVKDAKRYYADTLENFLWSRLTKTGLSEEKWYSDRAATVEVAAILNVHDAFQSISDTINFFACPEDYKDRIAELVDRIRVSCNS